MLPPDQLSWVSAESTRHVTALAEKGYCIHGDLEWLLADARDTGSAPVIRDEDLSRAAIETLARFAVRTVLSDPAKTTDLTRPETTATLVPAVGSCSRHGLVGHDPE